MKLKNKINKKYWRCLCLGFVGMFLTFTVAVVSATENGVATGPSKIAVLGSGDFVPDRVGIKKQGLPDGLAARIMERLTESRRFIVVERTALRSVVLEQRFGEKRTPTDMDRMMDKAVSDLEMIEADTLAVGGNMASHNDILKDFQNLGTATGADYIVYANLEKLKRSSKTRAIPHSERKLVTHNVDVRLYLRVVDVSQGLIIGAKSLRVQMPDNVLTGSASDQDEFSIYDEVGQQAASQIIDMVYPARIVGSEPWVLSRGSNDGVRVGDVYDIKREGKAVKDANGVVLGRVRTAIGQVKLTQVEQTFSMVEVVQGDIGEQDLAVRVEKSMQSQRPARSGADLSATKGSGKATLAVGKIQVNQRGRNDALTDRTLNRVTNDLIVKLSQDKHFDVMERQEIDQVLDEKTFNAIAQGDGMKGRLSALLGADYIVHATVDDFYILEKKKYIAAVDRTQVTLKGIVEATLRIVDVHSGKVVAANKVRINQRMRDTDGRREAFNTLVDEFTSVMVDELLSNLFPGDHVAREKRPSREQDKKIRAVTRPAF
ncbi:hypothetical protein MNBD_GAMMA16-703 [hydrothermal vent metagenome]|uniref:Curli production assembly/transport component CsgG n=1 Tax=hydrothermal vent metagenome TaxID=652676 RepID=A0A3B0Z803_9ZZZZ